MITGIRYPTDIPAGPHPVDHEGPTVNTPILYGIRNCDTVKKARLWLDEHGIAYRFHDFKTQGVPPDHIDHWLASIGWEKVLNRQGTAWRKLDAATQAATVDAASARSVMLAHSSVIKRPLVEWEGNPAGEVTVGFKPETWAALRGA